ncbi:MAG: hypothetical protein FJ197_11040 [Gammaproteobacteria bacterium]|nr:hypothetical protein [Gammaproteobacteria bacterium]
MSQPNNATRTRSSEPRFGIRVTAPAGEFFSLLVGSDWQTQHWFETREERDRAMADMGARHRYSRDSDTPTVRLEPIERLSRRPA